MSVLSRNQIACLVRKIDGNASISLGVVLLVRGRVFASWKRSLMMMLMMMIIMSSWVGYLSLKKLIFIVWETNFSRHNGGSIKGSLKPLNTIVLWCIGGFSGALNFSPMMPRDYSLSYSYPSERCCFSSVLIYIYIVVFRTFR